MSDALDQAFGELRAQLGRTDRLTPTHADPFFYLVHDPAATVELHRRLPRWRAALEQDGWQVHVESLAKMMWSVVDRAGHWDEWIEIEAARGSISERNTAACDSMRDVLSDEQERPRSWDGLARAVGHIVADKTPRRLVLLTDAVALHPWFRVRTIEGFVHDRVFSPTVLFYPGTRHGQFGLRFLGLHADDGNYRSTIVGGL